jgi:hypothetical protein
MGTGAEQTPALPQRQALTAANRPYRERKSTILRLKSSGEKATIFAVL